MNSVKIPSKSYHDETIPDTELSEGWAWCELGEINQINPRHLPNIISEDSEVSFVPMPAVDESHWRIRDMQTRRFGQVRRGYTHFAEGDVLFAKITPCMENGKAAIARNLVNGIGCGTTELHVLRPEAGIPPEFIYHYIHQQSFRERAAASMTGTAGQLRVPASFIEATHIPLPPLPEQRLIVARVEALLERVRKAKETLEKVPQIMKRFRQAVLKKAFSGELTAEWREQQPNLEPATELLKRIQEERKQRYEEEVRRAKAEGRRVPKKPKYLETEPLDASDLPEVPEGWVWCRLGELITIGSGNFIKRSEYTPNLNDDIDPYPVAGAGGPIGRTNKKNVDGPVIILGRVGACGALNLYHDGIWATDNTLVVKPVLTEQIKYLAHYFATINWGMFNSGSSQPLITQAVVNSLPIALPSPEEQQEIVRRVEALFKFADAVEKRAEEAGKQMEKITQSVLAKAFRGELTADFREAVKNWKTLSLEERKKYIFTLPQEEQQKALYTDEFPLEPAEQLLQRIREERAKREQEKKTTRARKIRKQSQQLKLVE